MQNNPSTGLEDMPNEILISSFKNSSLDDLLNLYNTNHRLRAIAIQIVRTKFSNDEKTEKLFYASRNGNTELVALLLDAGAHVRRYPIDVDVNFTSPLVDASREGHTEIVRMLINAGADVNASDAFGTTAIQEAIAEGHMGIVIMLRKAGAQE
tara:strand:- start:533 stop:991 length:459 start_codon:yes stop_codon:yes gene_type:complete